MREAEGVYLDLSNGFGRQRGRLGCSAGFLWLRSPSQGSCILGRQTWLEKDPCGMLQVEGEERELKNTMGSSSGKLYTIVKNNTRSHASLAISKQRLLGWEGPFKKTRLMEQKEQWDVSADQIEFIGLLGISAICKLGSPRKRAKFFRPTALGSQD